MCRLKSSLKKFKKLENISDNFNETLNRQGAHANTKVCSVTS